MPQVKLEDIRACIVCEIETLVHTSELLANTGLLENFISCVTRLSSRRL